MARVSVAAGAICHRPCSGEPRRPAKHAGESKRGTHSQSIDPSRATSAAVWQSPIRRSLRSAAMTAVGVPARAIGRRRPRWHCGARVEHPPAAARLANLLGGTSPAARRARLVPARFGLPGARAGPVPRRAWPRLIAWAFRALAAAQQLELSTRLQTREDLEPRRRQLCGQSAVTQIVDQLGVDRGAKHRIRDARRSRDRNTIAGLPQHLGRAIRQRLQLGTEGLYALGGGSRIVQLALTHSTHEVDEVSDALGVLPRELIRRPQERRRLGETANGLRVGGASRGFQRGRLRVASAREILGRHAVQLVDRTGDVGGHDPSVPRLDGGRPSEHDRGVRDEKEMGRELPGP
jgi:hypothetical protein